MQIEQAIMTHLLADSSITDLVGDRVFFVKAAQDVSAPYIVFFKVTDPPQYSHDGRSLYEPLFQFDIFDTTYSSVKEIAAVLKTSLEAYSGTLGGAGGVAVNGSFVEDENDFYEDITRLYHTAVDIRFWHNKRGK